jgi:hypothetical protein
MRLTAVCPRLAILAACGGSSSRNTASGTSPTTVVGASGIAARPTCESVVADPFFHGDGQIVASTSSSGRVSCAVQLRSSSSVLPKLGLMSKCPPQTSIIVTVDLDSGTSRWRYDAQATAKVDNGDCLR